MAERKGDGEMEVRGFKAANMKDEQVQKPNA